MCIQTEETMAAYTGPTQVWARRGPGTEGCGQRLSPITKKLFTLDTKGKAVLQWRVTGCVNCITQQALCPGVFGRHKINCSIFVDFCFILALFFVLLLFCFLLLFLCWEVKVGRIWEKLGEGKPSWKYIVKKFFSVLKSHELWSFCLQCSVWMVLSFSSLVLCYSLGTLNGDEWLVQL